MLKCYLQFSQEHRKIYKLCGVIAHANEDIKFYQKVNPQNEKHAFWTVGAATVSAKLGIWLWRGWKLSIMDLDILMKENMFLNIYQKIITGWDTRMMRKNKTGWDKRMMAGRCTFS